jgi:hypothetical protein
MNLIPSDNIEYPVSELDTLQQLSKLFQEWHFSIDKDPNELVFDGFYPYYFSQKTRILFIGRESLGLTGFNYIEELCYAYWNKKIGRQHINSNFFHKRMIYIAYGINNNMIPWQEIPMADLIVDNFAKPNGLSFAFMNISKTSNENDDWSADWNLINQSFNSSTKQKNFIKEQIKILNPNIIISMNLGEKIYSFGDIRELEQRDQISAYELKMDEKEILVLNTFHFTAPKKDDVNDFYEPICEMVKKYSFIIQ